MSFADVPHCAECALLLKSRPAPIAEGSLIDGRYRISRQLGEGGMGEVFEACDVHLRRSVAIKVMRPGAHQRNIHAFNTEARALASIRHRGIPHVHALGVHGLRPFFVMERIQGTSLDEIIAEHVENGDRIPLHAAVSIVRRLASALGAAHRARILHRDVKPENVLIEAETGRPVLVDFGVAARIEEVSDTSGIAGTPQFMAPECWQRGAITHRSDIYSLGCLAYELLTGQVPFGTEDFIELRDAHLVDEPRRPSSIAAELAPYDEVLLQALAKDPADRFPTCAAFEGALYRVSMEEEEEVLVGATELAPRTSGAIRVLVVDDDPVFVRVASRCATAAFEDADVVVSRASSGWAAVRDAERWMPQLLLLDFNLPELDGVEVLSRIREMPGGEAVSVLVMSGAVTERERWRFSVLGVQEFLKKPISFDEMVAAISRKGQERGWFSRAWAPEPA